MTIITKSALARNIGSIQLKLFDFSDKKIDFKNKAEKYAIPQDKNENIDYKISILDDVQYSMLKPVCPDCGSLYHTKQGFREINPKLDDGEKIKISLQRYKCKSCGKKYSTGLGNLKEKNKNFFKTVQDKIRESKKNKGGSLRKISKDVSNFLNLTISHQSVKNFLKIDVNKVKKEKNRIIRKFDQLPKIKDFCNYENLRFSVIQRIFSNYRAIMLWMSKKYKLTEKRNTECHSMMHSLNIL